MENYIVELILGIAVLVFIVGLYLNDKSSKKDKLPFSKRLNS